MWGGWPMVLQYRHRRASRHTVDRSKINQLNWTDSHGPDSAERLRWDVQFSDIFDQVNAYADGTPTNVVNPEVLGHARSRP